jgi:hypothetical protein
MRAGNQHIIQKQIIEINFENPDDSFGLQNQVAEVFYEKLEPRMEVLLDELFGENQFASIDKLEIDLGLLNLKNWEQEFTEQAILKLKDVLIQVNKKEVDTEKSKETAAEEAFFFFLENGFMPWNKRFDSLAELEQLLRINEKMITQLKKLIAQKSKTAERLVWQFSKNFTSRIIAEITKDRENALTEIFALLEKLNLLQNGKLMDALTYEQIDNHIVDVAILNLFASDENKAKVEQFFSFLLTKVVGNEELKTEIREIVNYLNTNKKTNSLPHDADVLKPGKNGKKKYPGTGKEDKQQPEEITKTDRNGNDLLPGEIYINNAGLILLHPFLENLFGHLELTTENKWINGFSQQTAVLISEFMITGNTEFEEFNLILNKILCGIDIDEIVPTTIILNVDTKTECDNLLKAVITHWAVLKNTSVDGLREAFLQRGGKLSKVDDGWLLQVEQKAIDVLLNHLPWGIGILKLPWMNEMLYVEWT